MGLFGFNAEKKLKKANEFLAKDIYYEAKNLFEEIIVRSDIDPAIAAMAKEGWKTARTELMKSQINEAKRLIQAGDTAEAAESCRAAIEQAGEDIDAGEAKALLAKVEQGMTETARLLDELEEAAPPPLVAEEEPQDDEQHLAGPEALFEVLLQSLPATVAETYRTFGREFRDGFLSLQEGRAKEALSYFDQMPEEPRGHPIARLERANALLLSERSEEALDELEQIDLPEELHRRRQEMRVDLLKQLGRSMDAETEARAIWEGTKEDPSAIVLYADILLRNEKPQEAFDLIEPLQTPNPEAEVGRIIVGSYVGLGKIEEARSMLEEAVERFFQGPGGLHSRFPLWAAQELLGIYLFVKEEPKRVKALIQHLIHNDPGRTEQYKQTLVGYLEKRQEEEG